MRFYSQSNYLDILFAVSDVCQVKTRWFFFKNALFKSVDYETDLFDAKY